MPFPLVVVPPVESERWSCLGCHIRSCVCCWTPIFPKGVAVHPEELNKMFRPLLTCVVCCVFALTSKETLLL
jgi:hypothetical protein